MMAGEVTVSAESDACDGAWLGGCQMFSRWAATGRAGGDLLYECERLRDQSVTLFFPRCHDAFPQSRIHSLRSVSSTSIELHPS